MNERQVQSVILFFYLSLLQEPLAIRASAKSISQIKKRIQKKKNSPPPTESLIVQVTQEYWKKLTRRHFLSKFFHISRAAFSPLISHKININAWKQFCKQSPPENVLAVIWSRILGFKDENIATGLGLSVGTVRYRVSHGLRELGPLINNKSHSKVN